jgi:predicted RNase H-like HicB family nuclease
MASQKFEVIVYQEGNAYVAQCLNVDVASEGDTEKQALANIREALELYFEGESDQEVMSVTHVKVANLTLQGA